MHYLMLMNTFAFVILMIVILFYINTSHKLNGCKYIRDQMWCYTDLNCEPDKGTSDPNE